MSILLSTNEVLELLPATKEQLVKLSAIHAVQYLGKVCPHGDKYGVNYRRIIDCPDCMAEVNRELGI